MIELDAVFDPNCSPRGIGIGISDHELWAMSGCCNERIHFNHQKQYWYCAKCTKFLQRRDDAPDWSCENLVGYNESTDLSGLLRWVAEWIGVDAADVDLKLEWNGVV